MSITIRPLRVDEWKSLKDFRLHAIATNPAVYTGTYEDTLQRSEETWRGMLDGKGRCIFGLFDGEILIGITGIFTFQDDTTGQSAFLGMSFIEPAYRGQGLSAMLYRERIDWALHQTQFKKLISGHRADNEPSKRAMLRHGFKFTHKEWTRWPDGKEDWDYKYELDLEVLRNKK